MNQICPVCGKTFDVIWPTQWVYKRDGYFLCSWHCLRKYDKGDGKDLKRKGLTLEEKKKAVQICLDGGNPLDYLRTLGCKDPVQTWFGIKKRLKESDPETYAKLPKRIQKKNDEPEVSLADAMKGMKDAADEFFGTCEEMGLTLDKEPEKTRFNAIVNPLPVCGVRSRILPNRKYQIDIDTGEMYLDNDGLFIRLSAVEWKALSKEILTALEQLGVEQ